MGRYASVGIAQGELVRVNARARTDALAQALRGGADGLERMDLGRGKMRGEVEGDLPDIRSDVENQAGPPGRENLVESFPRIDAAREPGTAIKFVAPTAKDAPDGEFE